MKVALGGFKRPIKNLQQNHGVKKEEGRLGKDHCGNQLSRNVWRWLGTKKKGKANSISHTVGTIVVSSSLLCGRLQQLYCWEPQQSPQQTWTRQNFHSGRPHSVCQPELQRPVLQRILAAFASKVTNSHGYWGLTREILLCCPLEGAGVVLSRDQS